MAFTDSLNRLEMGQQLHCQAEMLTIRHEQIQALDALNQPRLNRQVLDYLTSHYPSECQAYSLDALIRLAENAAQDAQSYGFAIRSDLFSFAALRLLDSDFDGHPRIQTILHRLPRRADTRMTEIIAALNETESEDSNAAEEKPL